MNLLSHICLNSQEATDMNIKHNTFFPGPCLILNARASRSDFGCTMLTTQSGKKCYSKVVSGYFSDYQEIYINIQASLCMKSSWVLTDPLLPHSLVPCPGGLLTPRWTERDLIGKGWSRATENTARPRVTVSTLTDRHDARKAECGWSCGGQWTETSKSYLVFSGGGVAT